MRYPLRTSRRYPLTSWRYPVRTLCTLLAVATLAIPAACSEADRGTTAAQGGRDEQRRSGPALAGDPDARPATAFDPEPAHVVPVGPMESPPVTLYGKAVWIADEAGVTVVDVTTGKTVARIEPEHKALYEATKPGELTEEEGSQLQYRVLPPQVARVGGEPIVLATVPVEIPSTNGGADQKGIEVIAIGADDAKVRWRLPVDVYGEPDGRLGAAVWRPPHDAKAVVQWTVDGSLTGTFVVALDRPRVLWQRKDFLVVDGYGDAVVGFRLEDDDTATVAGAALEDGRDLWSAEDLLGTISAGGRYDDGFSGGPWTLLKVDDKEPELREIATGRIALTERSGLKPDMRCHMRQGAGAVLCVSEKAGALALDVDSGEILWRRPAGDKPGAWRGTVSTTAQDYAYIERESGPAVIDVRTGNVVETDPGIAPDRANAYAGLVFDGSDVEIHLPR